jgi:DNA-binding transcriptional LysR family regulator
MTNDTISWELWRSFLAVLDQGNLTRAARRTKLTQPTLGRHIDALERSLGVALFTRSPRGLAPTDAAFELRPHAEAMASAADALLRAASGSATEAKGVVRITAPEIIGVEVLPPFLTNFRRKYPGIAIELAATNVTQNLLLREADIAVRLVPPSQRALVARKVGKAHFGLYAHRDYLERHGTPKTIEDLRNHTLVGFDKGASVIQALRAIPDPVSREAFAFRSDSVLAQQAMVRAGFGIGRGADVATRFDPAILPVLAGAYCVAVDIWIVMHEDARNSRRMRLMFDHLVAAFGALSPRRRNAASPSAKRS